LDTDGTAGLWGGNFQLYDNTIYPVTTGDTEAVVEEAGGSIGGVGGGVGAVYPIVGILGVGPVATVGGGPAEVGVVANLLPTFVGTTGNSLLTGWCRRTDE
jgi:hypothetical protein